MGGITTVELSPEKRPCWVKDYPDSFQLHDGLRQVAIMKRNNEDIILKTFETQAGYEMEVRYVNWWVRHGGHGIVHYAHQQAKEGGGND